MADMVELTVHVVTVRNEPLVLLTVCDTGKRAKSMSHWCIWWPC